jgi:hypothetical protein
MATGLTSEGVSEQWRQVVGYEGVYEVSDAGRVRRVSGGQGSIAGRVLTAKRSTAGYRHVDLSVGDRKVRHLIHRLVAFAFIGAPPTPEHCVNHINGDKTNNVPPNLKWVSQGENISHAYRTGLNPGPVVKGVKNPRAKLTDEQVKEIRALKGIEGARVIARRFGVSRSAIQFIHQGKHWT